MPDHAAWVPLWQGYQRFYAQALLAGASRVHWLTYESNTSAMQLYDRVAERPGFVQYRKKL